MGTLTMILEVPAMNMEVSFKTFLWAIIVGMGLHVGWGLISVIVLLAAQAVGRPLTF